MKVNVILFSDARRVIGSRELQFEMPANSTIRDLLDLLVRTYGKDFEETIIDVKNNHFKMIFSVNKKLCQVNRELEEDDTLAIFPAAGGG